jgi:hypothetical protein
MIDQLDMNVVRYHYDNRIDIHKQLLALFKKEHYDEYLDIALGITNTYGNFSASEHRLGEPIRAENNSATIINLVGSFLTETTPRKIVDLIYQANIKFLKISVGSEMAMMLKPDFFWVANVRTVWTHLLIKHNYDLNKANEELRLYRSQDLTSEMEYRIWKEIYSLMKPSIKKGCDDGNLIAKEQNVEVGDYPYLWFDVIASALYDKFSTNER